MSKSVPSVFVTYAQNGSSTKSDELGRRATQERAYESWAEQYLLIKPPPTSGKDPTQIFIALNRLTERYMKIAIHTAGG